MNTNIKNPNPNSMNPRQLTKLITLLASCCLALTPAARAVDPPPDGGYPNQNTAEGEDALFSLPTGGGSSNTAIGFDALFTNTGGRENTATGSNALLSNTIGNGNTATGANALFSNTIGVVNTATGNNALLTNTIGKFNTATGYQALTRNRNGDYNTATGARSLLSNSTGGFNTATGVDALHSNKTGSSNTATGLVALEDNTTGNSNTATGAGGLLHNTTGSDNAAHGASALLNNTTGSSNTASGSFALSGNTTGNHNTAAGQNALSGNTTGSNNTAAGQDALSGNNTGTFNIALGSNAGINLTTGSNNIDIFDRGIAGESNTIRIGRQGTQTTTIIAGISGSTVAGGASVIVDSTGHLGVATSSARFKDNIKPMDKASEAILALEPVTFRYKKDLDPTGIPQFGLVAEEVEKVNPDLVARDEQGKAYTVRYEAVNAMLLNEFLKEHRKVEEQQTTLAQQESMNAQQQREIQDLITRLNAQESRIQKVSAQLEANKVPPQMIANNQ